MPIVVEVFDSTPDDDEISLSTSILEPTAVVNNINA